jgi:ABC-type lipoprotein release transport system permease subunit
VTAAWYRAKGELRRRWRAALLLVLLVGVVGGAVLTTVAGARRSSSAYERFRQETLASDLDVAFDGPPSADLEAAADAVRTLPQVVALGRLDFPFLVPAGSGDYPYLDFLAAVSVDGSHEVDIDRPRVVEGSLPDPDDAAEIAISETYARESGLLVGDRAEFESFAPEQLEPLFTTGDAGAPAGPRFTLMVTAILDAPTFLSESSGDFQPRVVLSPAFADLHGDEVATYPGGFSLRLQGGAADADEVTKTLRELFEGSTMLEITPASEIDRKVDSGIDVIVTALLVCALVAALAGGVAIAQALTRHFAAQAESERWLAALGMTRLERVTSQAVTAIPIAVLGAVVAITVGVIASPLMPVGIARRAEPDPGVSVDGPVLLLGFVGIVIAVMALSVLAAAAIARRARRATATSSLTGPSRSMIALRRTRLAPPATTGVGMAVEPLGGTAWAVRSALLGVGFGVMGLISVLVFVASVDALVDSPHRYGAPFDAAVSGFSGDVLGEEGEELLADPTVARVALGLGGLGRVGGREVNTYAIESLKGDMSLTLLDGHEPSGGAEVVLGALTLDSAGVALGEEVEIEGARSTLRATVVGTAVFPVTDERSAPGRGVLLRRDDFERISAPDEINTDVLIEWADGVDPAVANEELGEATGTEVFPPRLPSDVNNLQDVSALPRALAAFLALLAALAVIHALISTVRMRRQDLAVLRALGFESRQLGSTLVWQATTIGLIGLVVGVPLGMVAGRVMWGAVAHSIGVVDAPVTPALAVVVVPIAVLVVLNAAAVVPSRLARKVSAAAVLRSGG